MLANQLRKAYVNFFTKKDHELISGAPLVPQDDSSILFVPAGMQPLVPYLLGEPHPLGKRLVGCQKCMRTDDINEVGDTSHLTFFEMLGNWSLGDYWKKDAVAFSYEFLTEVLQLDPDRLVITCFAGEEGIPRDHETYDYWRSFGIHEDHIFFLGRSENWWGPVGREGPCGPDTEMFYDMKPGHPIASPTNAPSRFFEIWNDVFMEYVKAGDGRYLTAEQKSIDTGLGLERVCALLQSTESVYEIDIFLPIMEAIRTRARKQDIYAERVIAEHSRAVVFALAEGIAPGNLDRPYIIRRLIRRAIRHSNQLDTPQGFLGAIGEIIISTYSDVYPELKANEDFILSNLEREEHRFKRTLTRGESAFESAVAQAVEAQLDTLPGETIFRLYDTFGFPPELTEEMAIKRNLKVNMEEFRAAFERHQELSRQSGARLFRGGLSERSPETVRLHTATHLLHQALRSILGGSVEQKGSNITPERLRFDFSFPSKVSQEDLTRVEELVNQVIRDELEVTEDIMTVDEALAQGAIGLFTSKYDKKVKVYSIGSFSKEICGGPHVKNTRELGIFRIMKEEAVSSGVRRIRAVLLPKEESKW